MRFSRTVIHRHSEQSEESTWILHVALLRSEQQIFHMILV